MSSDEDVISITHVVAPSTTPSSSLPPSGRKYRSHVWNHFVELPGSEKKAKCNYCSKPIKFKAGTTSMANHLLRCLKHPDRVASKRQKNSPTTQLTEVESSVVKFDQETCRLELVKMFVGAELPFRFVENEFFRNFVKVLQPLFDIPSRTTLRCAIHIIKYKI